MPQLGFPCVLEVYALLRSFLFPSPVSETWGQYKHKRPYYIIKGMKCTDMYNNTGVDTGFPGGGVKTFISTHPLDIARVTSAVIHPPKN